MYSKHIVFVHVCMYTYLEESILVLVNSVCEWYLQLLIRSVLHIHKTIKNEKRR